MNCITRFKQTSRLIGLINQSVNHQLKLKPIQSRPYVMWPPEFEDPVLRKEQIPELKESGEYERLKKVPIKAAPNDSTCSLFIDPMVQRFRNTLMERGKKELANRQLMLTYQKIKEIQLKKYQRAMQKLKDSQYKESMEEIETNPTKIIVTAIENGRPILGLDKVQVGAVFYDVPVPITKFKSEFRGIRWIIQTARTRPDKKMTPFHQALAEILTDTAEMKGPVIAKKNEHHRICELNRAYAHYRTGQ